MVDLIHAARVAMHEDEFFPPQTSAIVTSTISDRKLAQYTFEDELRILRALEPEFAIPFDFPVYGDMPDDQRETHVQQVAAGVTDMAYIMSELPADEVDRVCDVKDLPRELVEPVQDTTILPLTKGTTPDERGIMVDTAERVSAPVLTKYGVQYMTGSAGNYPKLREVLEHIDAESDSYPMLVIGLLSPSGMFSLEGLPDNVVAAAGLNQWVKHVKPASNSPDEMREAFEEFYNEVADTLDSPVHYDAVEVATIASPPPEPLEKTPGNAVDQDLTPSVSGAAEGGYGFGQRKRADDAMGAVAAGRKGGVKSPGDGTTTDNTPASPDERSE